MRRCARWTKPATSRRNRTALSCTPQSRKRWTSASSSSRRSATTWSRPARPSWRRPTSVTSSSLTSTGEPIRAGDAAPAVAAGTAGAGECHDREPWAAGRPVQRLPAGDAMRISLGDVTLWFDVSGPSVVPAGDTAIERPTLVAVHGGPGLDHINLKAELAPLAERVQVLYYDQRGHGRSDHCTSEFWNLQTWAYDLRRLCDVLGLVKPVVLGSSFGGHVA